MIFLEHSWEGNETASFSILIKFSSLFKYIRDLHFFLNVVTRLEMPSSTPTQETLMVLLQFSKRKKQHRQQVSSFYCFCYVYIILSLFSVLHLKYISSIKMYYAEHPNVVSVFLNKARKLHTTRSWDFLGLENNGVIHRSSIWRKARFGEDVIIANLDTGQCNVRIYNDRCDCYC